MYSTAERLRHGGHFANTIVVLSMLRDAIHGNVSGIAEDVLVRGIYEFGKQGTANMLESPKVMEWRSRPTQRTWRN